MGRRKKHVSQPTDGMRSMWEFVFVSQFLRVFQARFGFIRFSSEDLEVSFVEPDNLTLFGIFSRLLRVLSQRQDIKVTSWQDYMREELEERESEKNPLRDGRQYCDLSPEERVMLLKFVIDLIIDNDEDEELKDFAGDFLDTNSTRVQPIGTDASNNIYWYFDDLRLYRETPGKKVKGSRKGQARLSWETLCVSLADWDNILRTFKRSTNSSEKKLHQYLKNELYPQVMPLIKENEKEKESEILKKKKSPRIQQKDLLKQEEERNAVIRKEEEEIELEQEKMRKVEDIGVSDGDGGKEQVMMEKGKEKEKDVEHRKRGRRKEIEGPVSSAHGSIIRGNHEHPAQLTGHDLGQGGQEQFVPEGKPHPTKPRRRHSRIQEKEEFEKIRKEREELERKVDEEIRKQESIYKEADLDTSLVPRSKRRCVIIREQMNKKKEWWEEENIGSDDEDEEDADSDSSDGPRRKKKPKLSRPVEMPIPPGRQRVYVFSTALANRAAEAVQQGAHDGIVSFHRSQPATTPYLRLEKNTTESSRSLFEQQKSYLSRQAGQSMARGYGGYPHSEAGAQPGGPGYAGAQWPQFQQQYYKERPQRQHQAQVMEDIQQLLFGNGNSQQSSGTPSNGMYPRGAGYNQQAAGGGMGQQANQFGYSASHASSGPQPSSAYMDSRMHDHFRQQMQQQAYQRYSSQQQQQQQQQQNSQQQPQHQPQHQQQQQQTQQQHQQQQFFQRSSLLSSLQSPSPQSPTSVPSPLGGSVRSPPPPYPGSRTTSTDTRNPATSPAQVPSPTSAGSPHTPQTPLTPHTPRGFPAAGLPSPTDAPKQPFSPSNQQSTFPGYSRQSSTHSQGGESDTSLPRPGFIELSRGPYQKSAIQPVAQNSYSPLYGSRQTEETRVAFTPRTSQDSSLHSPSEVSPRGIGPFAGGPPNKSPFPGHTNQLIPNHGPFPSTSMSKSFSVESLTAPTQSAERNSHVISGSEQSMSPYSGFYYPPNKYPQMYSQPHAQYQYPPHLQHPGSYYNSQYGSNVYLGRGSLPVHHPARDSGL